MVPEELTKELSCSETTVIRLWHEHWRAASTGRREVAGRAAKSPADWAVKPPTCIAEASRLESGPRGAPYAKVEVQGFGESLLTKPAISVHTGTRLEPN